MTVGDDETEESKFYDGDGVPLCQTEAKWGTCEFRVLHGYCWNEHNHVPVGSSATLPTEPPPPMEDD